MSKATCPKCGGTERVDYGWYSEDFTAVPEFHCWACGHVEQERLGEYEPREQKAAKAKTLEKRWKYQEDGQ